MPDTIADALSAATRYWETNERNHPGRRGPSLMVSRAKVCADILGSSRKLRGLGPDAGTKLLLALSDRNLSRRTVGHYYGAGRRMLELAGVSTRDWPRAPTPPRKPPRSPVTREQMEALVAELEASGQSDTAELVRLMWDTGLRVNVEALKGDWSASGGRLDVEAGKGGHARSVPYKGPVREPLGFRPDAVTYETHVRRMAKACERAGLPRIQPHDLRRAFVKRTYEQSGKDLRVAQVLAGHASPGTTASYIGVDWATLEEAVA